MKKRLGFGVLFVVALLAIHFVVNFVSSTQVRAEDEVCQCGADEDGNCLPCPEE